MGPLQEHHVLLITEHLSSLKDQLFTAYRQDNVAYVQSMDLAVKNT